MKDSHYRISLDIHSTQSQVSLPVKQGDTSRKVFISLCEGGNPYQIDEDCLAVFSARKPDGNIIENNCIIANNVIEYTITEQTSVANGMLKCEIKLYGGDSGLITSPRFTIIVDARAVSDAEVESSSEYLALTGLYTITNSAAANANEKAELANTAAQNADAKAALANTAATNANTVAEETKAIKTEVETKLANGEFKGDKGDTGEKGDPGEVSLAFADATYTKITRTDSLEKRITNLEQGIVPSPFETDNTVAYRKDVPSNALPYAEVAKIGGMTYKDGDTLRSAPVTEVESVGANLIPQKSRAETVFGITYTPTAGGGVHIEGTSTGTSIYIVFNKTLPAGDYSFAGLNNDANINRVYAQFGWKRDDGAWDSINIFDHSVHKQFDVERTCLYQIVVPAGSTVNETVYPMGNKGTTALPYTPYVRNTLPIPTEVQALDGYGEGVNESVYNYIDWEKKQFLKKLKTRALTGTEDFVASSISNRYNLPLFDCLPSLHLRTDVPYVCSHYTAVHYDDRADKTMYMYTGSGHFLQFWDSDFSTVADFKAHLAELYANGNPVIIVYPLAEPIIADISDLLPEDNFIGVEGGGTVTFKNEYEYAVPSEITYQIKGASV